MINQSLVGGPSINVMTHALLFNSSRLRASRPDETGQSNAAATLQAHAQTPQPLRHSIDQSSLTVQQSHDLLQALPSELRTHATASLFPLLPFLLAQALDGPIGLLDKLFLQVVDFAEASRESAFCLL
jgi:hypothetical protein